MGSNTSDWPYYYWTDTKPTEEGLWWRREKKSGREEMFLIKNLKMAAGNFMLCYLEPDCGWAYLEEDDPEYFEWSSKPIPRPSRK